MTRVTLVRDTCVTQAGLEIEPIESGKGSLFESKHGNGFGISLKNYTGTALRLMFMQEAVRDEWAAVLVRV